MEPLSFQDLVGQRIQKIIKLVRSMEHRIEELIVSFGIKLKNHKEDPTKSFDDLNKDVEVYLSELKGPQREGEGLDQDGIDDLLSNL
jgi:chemotaxis regulatin CheY-phosphate phosphatase CheZ